MQKQNVKNLAKPVEKPITALSENDVFNWNQLGLVSFQRWKRGMKSIDAIEISTGQRWTLRTQDYTKKVEVVGIHIKEETASDINNLKPGDLFVIQIKKDAVLLKFIEKMSSGKIRACNPMDPSLTFKVDATFTMTKIENIK